jgi:uncharacterized membrane protein YiaA
MEYYLLLGFLLFVGLFAHVVIAMMVNSILEDTDSTGWYKKKHKKYLLIPGVAEVALGLLILTFLGVVTYAFILTFFED